MKNKKKQKDPPCLECGNPRTIFYSDQPDICRKCADKKPKKP